MVMVLRRQTLLTLVVPDFFLHHEACLSVGMSLPGAGYLNGLSLHLLRVSGILFSLQLPKMIVTGSKKYKQARAFFCL